MPEHHDIVQEAGNHFRFAADLSFEDAALRRLRYHLFRLTVVGLSREDIEELGELGRLAFRELDVTEQAAKIKQRVGASSLALVIADIIESSKSVGGPVSLKAVMLGAVLGAYTSLRTVSGMDESIVATLGAIGGAVAVSTSTFIYRNINEQSCTEYVRMDE